MIATVKSDTFRISYNVDNQKEHQRLNAPVDLINDKSAAVLFLAAVLVLYSASLAVRLFLLD